MGNLRDPGSTVTSTPAAKPLAERRENVQAYVHDLAVACARVLETTLSAEICRQVLLTEERDLAELCVNCVDDRRAFPIAWKPYDL